MDKNYDSMHKCIDPKQKNVAKRLFRVTTRAPSDKALNQLFKQITDISEHQDTEKFWQENIIKWLVETMAIANTSKNFRDNIKTFALKLSIFSLKDATMFKRLSTQNAVESIVQLAKNHDKMLYVDLIDAFVEHQNGFNYVKDANCWADILQLTTESQNEGNLVAATKGYNAITKLIERAAILNLEFCNLVLNIISFPIVNILQYLPERITVYSSVKEIVLESLYYNIIFNAEILERLLERANYNVLKLFAELKVKTACEKLSLISKNENFSIEVNKIIVVLLLCQLVETCDGVEVADHEVLLRGILSLVRREFEKGHLKASCKMCGYAQKCWISVRKRLPKYLQNRRLIDLEFQLMVTQLTPLFSIIKRINPSTTRIYFMDEDLKVCYMVQACRKLSTLSIYLGFNLLDMMFNFPLFETEHVALHTMTETMEYYSPECLGMCFEMLMYCLNEIMDYVIGAARSEVPLKEQIFINHLLKCIMSFVEAFDLSWRHSVTAVDVVSLIIEFLSYEMWTTEITVAGLKLLNLALQKNMSPNLVLLIDASSDSSLIDIGPLLYSSCLDSSWEIRDTALSVLLTVFVKANSKYHKHFPCLKGVYSEIDLMNWVATMALDDTNLNVRASALICLQQMAEIEEGISEDIFQCHGEVYNMLTNEPEPTIRNEAVVLISKIYKNRNTPEEDLLKIYASMEQVACTDKDAQVQSNAIRFWEIVIQKHLTKQGMVDGEFPEVTFSKELKKIVTITVYEIKKRLIDALNQLSYIGCLAIFVDIIQSKGTSQEVFTTALDVVTNFHELLRKYQITSEVIEESLTTSTASESFASSSAQFQQTDQLIDEIVNEIDSEADLLSNIDTVNNYEGFLSLLDVEKLASTNTKRFVTPYEFVDFLYETLPMIIDEKRRESSDFDSFTDDEVED
ncbi:uncharacterized protein LOC132705583 isoform X2 [Cylas formicarius]|uniref:uncharacterized protein LOC132705583 isoform X2 n=1 Tax=Cylas formicarius TaxID=197179 RepID=UPI002958562D|nr:uncharacterized protein LOC132705583 isoform X2 [Cylas formicarius]